MKIQSIDRELTNVLKNLVDNESTIDEKVAHMHPEYRLSAKTCIAT